MRKTMISVFLKDQRGSFATIGGLTIGVAAAAIGLSMNVAHTYEMRADVQRALDAALLSAARSDYYANPQAIVQSYVESYVRNAGISAQDLTVTASYDQNQGVLKGDVKFRVGLIMPMPSKINQSLAPRVSAEVMPPGAARHEIALALDLSGSMRWQTTGGGTRLAALQSALNTMFNQIEAQSTEHGNNVYVSIVPYAKSVNISNLRGVLSTSSYGGRSPANAEPSTKDFFGVKRMRQDYLSDYYNVDMQSNADQDPVKTSEEVCYNNVCTTAQRNMFYANHPFITQGIWAAETYGARFAQDVAPDSATTKAIYATYEDIAASDRIKRIASANYFNKTWATPVHHILPLTNNVADLRAYADSFVAYGGTGGHLGMEWAWRAISPNWSGVWAMQPRGSNGRFRQISGVLPASSVSQLWASGADPLHDLIGDVLTGLGLGGGGAEYAPFASLPTPYGAGHNTVKTIVMMTDGALIPMIDPAAALDPRLSGTIEPTAVEACMLDANMTHLTGSNRTTVENQCRASYVYFEKICAAAKAQGIRVYTIAFTNDAAGSLASMRRCATIADQAFAVETSAQLTSAFTRIFRETSELRVSR